MNTDRAPSFVRVVALFVAEDGPYAADPRFDAWGITRDARRYQGPLPVVAHPPCERWGRFAEGSPSKKDKRLGDDGGCFEAALRAVRTYGGVLEHPQGSHAFRRFGLPVPDGKRWTPRDAFWGRSIYIDQGAYGHPAKKATWLYAVLPGSYPRMLSHRIWGRPYIGGDGYHSSRERARAKASGKHAPKEQVPTEWNWRTPDTLKDRLYAMAVSCVGWKPVSTQVLTTLGVYT